MLVLVLIGVGAGVVVGGVGDADAGVALVLVVFLSCFGDGSAGLGGAVRVCVVHLLRLMNVWSCCGAGGGGSSHTFQTQDRPVEFVGKNLFENHWFSAA